MSLPIRRMLTLQNDSSLTKEQIWGNGDYEITFNNRADIGYILTLIRQSYEKN
jgi:predicted transport protein